MEKNLEQLPSADAGAFFQHLPLLNTDLMLLLLLGVKDAGKLFKCWSCFLFSFFAGVLWEEKNKINIDQNETDSLITYSLKQDNGQFASSQL